MQNSRVIFNPNYVNHMVQPMFLGDSPNVARYDQVKYPWIDRLTEKQLSFFWRPEEVDLSQDSSDFSNLEDNEQHCFTSNLKYQILLDSVQGRAPSEVFIGVTSLPELETWIQTWTFSETIHSRSYTHIIRNIISDPGIIFDHIIDDNEIIKRAVAVTEEYDLLLSTINSYNKGETSKEVLQDCIFRTMVSVNVLESVRFYVSFACSFAFAERKLMEGNAKIIKLIARDEALHLAGTQRIIQTWINGGEGDEWQQTASRNFDYISECFADAAKQEKDWADYLFKDGSMIGLNSKILQQYIEYITDVRIKALGCSPIFNRSENPLPWMNSWLQSDNVQVAPQETEISSYLTGQVDTSVETNDFNGFDL